MGSRSTICARTRSPTASRFSRCGRPPRRISCPPAARCGRERFIASRISRNTLRYMVEAEKKALAGGASRQAAIDAVRDSFYRGEIARKIDAFSKANNGLLRYEDMAAFKLQLEEPVSTTFHGYPRLQVRFLEPGTRDDPDAEYSGRVRGSPAAQFGRLYSSPHGSAEAGVRGSRHLLRRSQVQSHPGRRAAFEGICAPSAAS